jgi:hypothetical protein
MTTRWALLGKEGEEFSEFAADILEKRSPYQVTRRIGNIYFRTSFEDKVSQKPIEVSSQITRKVYKNKANYRLLVHQHQLYKQYLNVFALSDEQISGIKENLDKHDNFSKFNTLSKYVFYASNNQIESTLSDIILPSFFNWFPDGAVLIATIDASLYTRLTALRALGAIDKLGKRKIKSKDQFINFLALENVQPPGLARPSKYLAIPLSLSLPKPIGFLATRMVDTIIFLFGKHYDDIRGDSPRSGIEFYRSAASLILNEDKSVVDEKGELSLDINTIDTFPLVNKEFSQEAWIAFIRQFIVRLNKFFVYLTDPSNFVNDDNEWASITQYYTWLSFERLCDETILLITEENQYLRKMALFRILDQLASLGHSDHRRQTAAFSDFLLPSTNPDSIEKSLLLYKGEIAEYLSGELILIREKLLSTIIDSVVFKDMKDSKNMKINLLNGEQLTYAAYTKKIVRAIRNTAHGYSPDEYLITNKGNLPDKISLLAVIALLAFIAEPKNFLRSTWNE